MPNRKENPLPKVAVLEEINGPLTLQDFPEPRPSPGGAIVEVALGGICGTDVHLRTGHLNVPLPLAMGHEAVGWIRKLDDDLTTDVEGQPLAVGDRVAWANNIPCGSCHECLVLKEPTLCLNRKIYGINRRASDPPHLQGGWADMMALEAGTTIIKIPESVSFEEVITLGCAGPTAIHGVVENLRIEPGSVVAVQGAGPVGLASAMYAKAMGAALVVILGGPTSRIEMALQIAAADAGVDMDAYPTASERLDAFLKLTPNGRGADVVIECAGVPSAVAESIDLARPNGQLLVLGQYTDHGATPINPHLITRKQLKVFGSWGFAPAHYVKYVKSLPLLAKNHDLASILSVYPLHDVNDALADVASGSVTKAALRPDSKNKA